MKPPRAYVLLDTNLALHFKRANEIDWCALAKSHEVVLVIAPVFLRELEEEKVYNKSPKLRSRAAEAMRWLERLIGEGGEIRKNVTLDVLHHEPLLNFVQYRLSERINDDHLGRVDKFEPVTG